VDSDGSTFLIAAVILMLVYISSLLLIFRHYHKRKVFVPIKVSMLSFGIFILILLILPLFTSDKYPYGTIVGLLIFASLYSLFLFFYLRLMKKLAERDQFCSGNETENKDG